MTATDWILARTRRDVKHVVDTTCALRLDAVFAKMQPSRGIVRGLALASSGLLAGTIHYLRMQPLLTNHPSRATTLPIINPVC